MIKLKLAQCQQDYEEAFIMEYSIEDIKLDKDAKKLFKQIKKQGRIVNIICKLLKYIGLD